MIDSIIYMTSEGSGFFSYSLHKNKLSKIILSDLDSLSGLFHISAVDDSTLLLGGLGHIVVYNIKTKTNSTYSIGKKLNVYDIEEDKNSKTFLVATDVGLLNFKIDKSGKIILGKKTVPTKTAVKDILIDSDQKELWLATNHGLELRRLNDFVKIKEYSKLDEIKHIKVTALQKDKNGRIWASTYSGITVIDYKNNKTYFIDRFDGLRNEEFNNKSSAQLIGGSYIFGGINMYDIVDSEILNNNNYLDRFYITGIQKTNFKESHFYSLSDFDSGKISFNTGIEDLIIYLSNFDYEDRSGYRFEYKKGNLDWVPVLNNRIRLSNLSAGNYKLKIRMLNPLGVKIDEKTYTLIAKVPFYRVRLFFVLAVAFICLIIALSLFLLYRNSKIENLTKERIALDLQDEVGATVNSVLMTLDNTDDAGDNGLVKGGLNKILFNIMTFIDSMSAEKSSLKDFEDDIRAFLTNTVRDSSCQYNFSIEGSDLSLRQELYRDLKLCLYDMIMNTLKDDSKKIIEIEMLIVKNLIKINLKEYLIAGKVVTYYHNHIDISNFKKRTERYGGSFEIKKSAEGISSLQFFFET